MTRSRPSLCRRLVISCVVLCVASIRADSAAAQARDLPPSEARRSAVAAEGAGVEDDVHDTSLRSAVRRINRELADQFAVLDPRPLTSKRLRQAIESAATEIAESEGPHRGLLVARLQKILSDDSLPEDVRLHSMPIIGTYKRDSPMSRKVMWLNLDHVVSMTPVGGSDRPSLAREMSKGKTPDGKTASRNELPPRLVEELEGPWTAALPAGFLQPATLKYLGDGRFRMSSKASVFNGVYFWSRDLLMAVEPEDPRMRGLTWRWDGEALMLINEPRGTPTGASYTGTQLTRGPANRAE